MKIIYQKLRDFVIINQGQEVNTRTGLSFNNYV